MQTSRPASLRRPTVQVAIGDVMMGSDHPIRVQSMTTTNTMDTLGTIEQSIRMIDAGCELVRITAPSIREAKNLEAIRAGLRERGYTTPLVADIHYTPNAAEIAARLVEKVRINPGNYVDKKQFAVIDYTDAEYAAELDRIRERFTPLVRICKEYGTAMRIGTNHGSLSDRIVNRYGDNPVGMVESALEFLRIAEDESYHNIVLSMKSSNPIVMIEAYRLLVRRLNEEGLQPYPLHLGVTEAGDGEDGRVKSAIGIGTLLEDGLGDTIRVSLTEEPEAEIPVAMALASRYDVLVGGHYAAATGNEPISLHYHRSRSRAVSVIGGDHVPRVIADLRNVEVSSEHDLAGIGHHYAEVTDKWTMTDQAAEFVLMGRRLLPFMPPTGIRQLVDADFWATCSDKLYTVPVWTVSEYRAASDRHRVLNIVACSVDELTADVCSELASMPTTVLMVHGRGDRTYRTYRDLFRMMESHGHHVPVILHGMYQTSDLDDILMSACTDVGSMLADGHADGLCLSITAAGINTQELLAFATRLSFGLLQATRLRMTKTEYISCPSCGRTLFDLQETTALIRSQTDHLKGVKIGIMGCIVNGPGEMADADYGYVGSGPDRITLYRGQDIVKRNVPTAGAVNELIDIIRGDGRWVERSS
ncbi:MAG: (E)-4-hydroxy-3-methylbut-2-enyl-diphosphate synthase [Candidatus Kapabacteria bacterium]|nr:(E)-4-hydroxy-3-methylbut-2-enyl-diphosphate synthase [Candidatus Kapabacteria bacterium]